MRVRAALLSLSLALVGCQSNPPYQRPAMALPQAWQVPLAVDDAATARGEAEWWAAFHDDQLQQLLQQALAGSPDLRIAVDRMRAAAASVGVARSFEYPSISFDAGPTDPVLLRLAGQNSRNHVDDAHYQVGLNASYEIDFWGRVSSSVDAAQFEYQASRDDVDTARIALLSGVARAYFALRSCDALLQQATRKSQLAAQRVQLLQMRVDAGRIVVAPLVEAQLAAQDADATVADLRLQRHAALQQLQALIGDTGETLQLTPELSRDAAAVASPTQAGVKDDSANDSVKGSADDSARRSPPAVAERTNRADEPADESPDRALDVPLPPAGLPSSLLERRADVRAAEARLASAQAQVAVARAARFPQVQLTAEFGYLTAAVVHILHAGSALIGIGPGVSLPIFDGGRSAAEVEIRRQQYDAALAEYQKSVLAAFGDVETALLANQAAREAAARWARAEDLQRSELQRTQLSLDAGHADRLQLLDAQQRAIELRVSALLAARQQRDSLVLLYQALGGGAQASGHPDEAAAPESAAPVEAAATRDENASQP